MIKAFKPNLFYLVFVLVGYFLGRFSMLITAKNTRTTKTVVTTTTAINDTVFGTIELS